jgi:hypothetical protein
MNSTTTSDDMIKGREWASPFLSGPAELLISYVFGERSIRGIPNEWQPGSHRRRIDANISERVFEGNDPETGL